MRAGWFVVIVVACIMLVSSGCAGIARTPVRPPVALAFTNIAAPLSTEFSGQPGELRQGKASSYNALGLAAWGDCSLEAAAEDGGLVTMEYCDYSFFSILGLYSRFTVIAHGR